MEIIFSTLPENATQMQEARNSGLDTPFKSAALFIAALCSYERDKEQCFEMINIIKGPQSLSPYEKQFIRDRMTGKAGYIGKSYFKGSSPQNNYTPSHPLAIEISETPYSYSQQGYATVYMKTSGADSPRPIKLREKNNEWFLWEFGGILADIRIPQKDDLWA